MRANAEGIETAEQATILRGLGCEEGQGWLYGRPRPAEAIDVLRRKHLALVPCAA